MVNHRRLNFEVVLEPTITVDTRDHGSKTLRLDGVLLHHGVVAQNGHYTALVRSANGTGWTWYDDERVTRFPSAEAAFDDSRAPRRAVLLRYTPVSE